MLADALQKAVEKSISGTLGKNITVEKSIPTGGGCINHALALHTNAGKFFCKWNDAARFPEMFEAEAKGLKLLKANSALYIPEVIAYGETDNKSFLVLELTEGISRNKDFFHDFGAALARMHQSTNKYFGLDHDNYIGSLKQSNKPHEDWVSFFIEERLLPQMLLTGFSGQRAKRFENLFKHLETIFPPEKPALLHGDLWGGNYIVSPSGTACLIDPAVYYGNRETDIAMTKLFGGFDRGFYDSYIRTYPLENGWKERVDICNLYPLLVHVNLFGGSYVYQVDSIINKF